MSGILRPSISPDFHSCKNNAEESVARPNDARVLKKPVASAMERATYSSNLNDIHMTIIKEKECF